MRHDQMEAKDRMEAGIGADSVPRSLVNGKISAGEGVALRSWASGPEPTLYEQ